jgi:hypothetical protein
VEAVVLRGERLPESLLGLPVERYRLLACSAEGLEVIPMQVEERDENGIILVEEGPRADRGDGAFSARDELVFMARDAGPPCEGRIPEGCTNSVRITLTDRESGRVAAVFLADCENRLPMSAKDYIRWDPKARTVVTDRYRFGWKTGEVYAYDYITLGNGPDILDRVKVRCTVGLWRMKYTFHEDQYRHTFIGYTDGPVRVTWKAENVWRLGYVASIPSPQYLHFYPAYAMDRNMMDTHGNPAAFGLDFSLEFSHDLAIDQARGYRLCANPVEECLSLEGDTVEEGVRGLLEKEMVWGGIHGPEGAMMTRLKVDPRLTARVEGVFVFDRDAVDKHEYIRGALPQIGFRLVDWKDVRADLYEFTLYHYFMHTYSKAEFERHHRMITDPLEVSVEPTVATGF